MYERVSSAEQAKGYSISTQRERMANYAAANGFDIVAQFGGAESAFRPGRREFAEMRDYLRSHKDVKVVLVDRIDRITRNLLDFAKLIETDDIKLVSATEHFGDGPTGVFGQTIVAATATLFSAVLSNRVSDGMCAKATAGLWPSSAPIGYRNDRASRTIVVDPERGPRIRELFATYDREEISLKELALLGREIGLRTRGGHPLSKSALHKALQNPIYCGGFWWRGVLYAGTHEPLVSRQLFQRVQDKLHGRGKPRGKRRFAFRGLLRCGRCGCLITAGIAKKRWVYYRCTHGRGKCAQPYVREDRLGERLAQVVQGVHLSREVVDMLLDVMQEDASGRVEARTKRVSELRAEAGRLKERRDRAYLDKLDAAIDENRWRELEADWSARALAIRAEIERLEGPEESDLGTAQAALELLERAPELYSQQSEEERARFLKLLVWNCDIDGEKIVPHYKKPFDLVAEGKETGTWYARQDLNLRPLAPEANALSPELRAR